MYVLLIGGRDPPFEPENLMEKVRSSQTDLADATGIPPEAMVCRQFSQLQRNLRGYLAGLLGGGTEIYGRLLKKLGVRPALEPNPYPAADRLLEMKFFFEAEAAAGSESARAPDPAGLRFMAEDLMHPGGTRSQFSWLHAALGCLDSSLSALLRKSPLDVIPFNIEEELRNAFPDASEEDIVRWTAVRNAIQAQLECSAFTGGRDPVGAADEPPPPPPQPADRYCSPVQLRTLTAAMRKLSKSSKAQYAYIHNRIFDIALKEAGGGLKTLEARIDAGQGDREKAEAVKAQFREASTARAVFARDAKSFGGFQHTKRMFVEVIQNLQISLTKASAEPLRDALALLLRGLEIVLVKNCVDLKIDLNTNEDRSIDDRVSILSAYDFSSLSTAETAAPVKISVDLGDVEIGKHRVPGFDGEAVWKDLSSKLDPNDYRRLAFYMRNAVLITDAVLESPKLSETFEKLVAEQGEFTFNEVKEAVEPVRLMIKPAIISAFDTQAAYGAMPVWDRCVCSTEALFRRFAESVVTALNECAKTHPRQAALAANGIASAGSVVTTLDSLMDDPEAAAVLMKVLGHEKLPVTVSAMVWLTHAVAATQDHLPDID